VAEESVATRGAILVLDGLFLHTERILKALDYTIFVDAPFDTCVARARARNPERMGDDAEIERLYRSRYIPGFAVYVAECDPQRLASVTIPNG
jgi:uridine kinase